MGDATKHTRGAPGWTQPDRRLTHRAARGKARGWCRAHESRSRVLHVWLDAKSMFGTVNAFESVCRGVRTPVAPTPAASGKVCKRCLPWAKRVGLDVPPTEEPADG